MLQVTQDAAKDGKAGRIYNFSAGPAVLPLEVLETIQSEIFNYQGSGMSVMEMSHRSATFEGIIHTAEADLRQLLNIPANYKVLFLQGGASLQFTMIPMNLLSPTQEADYIVSGSWAKTAYQEAAKVGKVRVAASTESENFVRVPRQDELKLNPDAAYVHFTSNNTIYGTQSRTEPEVGNVPLVCDASSDILSRPVDISKYGVLYAGAQKNAGIAGVTLAIIREDLLERSPNNMPAMLDYRLLSSKESLHNTPPAFAVYVNGLVIKWLLSIGGLEEMARRNEEKAAILYRAIDESGGFYRGHSEPASRSYMNVTYRLPSEELEKKFVKEATAQGLDGIKGYRTVGGVRASIYNAFPREGVEALAALMRDFQARNG